MNMPDHSIGTSLSKTATGIEGLDEITNGGLPTGRTTLVCGSAGTGKTVLGMEFLIHGILDHGENGVFMAFEETETELAQNVASFGYELEQLQREGKLSLDHVVIERNERRASRAESMLYYVQRTDESDLASAGSIFLPSRRLGTRTAADGSAHSIFVAGSRLRGDHDGYYGAQAR
jgi:archaellum biogenesis ATPase FlaH